MSNKLTYFRTAISITHDCVSCLDAGVNPDTTLENIHPLTIAAILGKKHCLNVLETIKSPEDWAKVDGTVKVLIWSVLLKENKFKLLNILTP